MSRPAGKMPGPRDLVVPIATPDWRKSLYRRGGNIVPDERNVLQAFRSAPELKGLLRFNEFALNIELTRSPPWRQCAPGAFWEEGDDGEAMIWLQRNDIPVRGASVVAIAALAASRDFAYHPVQAYLNGLVWDGNERLKSWTVDYLCALGDSEYLAAVGRRFMISAVARALLPGCQADSVLVLEGAQGIGKTSAARTLAVKPNWFAGNLPDIHSKDAPLQLAGRWIVEIAELKAVRNSQVEATKSFITETIDTFRPPYGRRTAQFPRQCVFIATTNETEYLRDRTGNRRYWPIRCDEIDVPGLLTVRDQLWAEAVHAFRNNEPWHLTPYEQELAARQQKERVVVTEIESDVAEYLAGHSAAGMHEVSVRDVLIYGLGLDPDLPSYSESAKKLGTEVAAALEACGWHKVARKGADRRTMYQQGRQGRQGI